MIYLLDHLGYIGIAAGLLGAIANLIARNWPAIVWALASACWAAAYQLKRS